MGARCYDCGEKFGRCYEHAGSDCPPECRWGEHECPAYGWDELHDLDEVAREFGVDL